MAPIAKPSQPSHAGFEVVVVNHTWSREVVGSQDIQRLQMHPNPVATGILSHFDPPFAQLGTASCPIP